MLIKIKITFFLYLNTGAGRTFCLNKLKALASSATSLIDCKQIKIVLRNTKEGHKKQNKTDTTSFCTSHQVTYCAKSTGE